MNIKKLLSALLFCLTIIPIAQSQGKVKNLPTTREEEFEEGIVPGDHTQHMLDVAYCESDPDRIYMAQDVGGVWVSVDAGKNWNTLSNYGLYSPFMIGIEVDPLDPNRVVSAAQCRHYDLTNMDYQGIYLSKDGGVTWDRKEVREKLGEIRNSSHIITYAPSSKDTALGFATRWYAAFSEYRGEQTGSSSGADDGLLYSDDGGESWTEVRKLDSATFGYKIRGIKADPTNADHVFIYGTNGLIHFTDVTNPTGDFDRLSGKNGLPEGDIYGQIYISQDGDTLIAPVLKDGLYKSTDGGANWIELYDYDNTRYCAVNEGYPNYIYVVPVGEQLRFTTDGGQTWNTNVSVNQRPGYPPHAWWTRINGSFTRLLPDPRNPNRAFVHTNSWNSQTDDSGFNWYHSDAGFNGAQHIGLNSQQMFDPLNPDRFAYFMIDKGVYYTNTRGQWFYENTLEPSIYDISHKSIKGGVLLPDSIILASAGSSTSGKLCRSTDNGQTWTVVLNSATRRWVIAYDPDSSNYCYQGRERSNDYGATWETIPNIPENTMICGMAMSDGRVIYAIENASEERTKIYRSEDRGDSWELVITAGWDLTWIGADKQFTFLVHPQSPNIVFTNSEDGQISKWDLEAETRTDFDVSSGSILYGGSLEEDFFCYHFAIDPRYPDVMYMLNRRVNTGNKLFRTQDGGATWENISGGFPNTDIGGLAVSPVTGELYFSGQNGSRVMLPPYETSNTAYELIQFPNSHFDEPYTNEQMPYVDTLAIPGKIEAEDYDIGGEGIAYHDETEGNEHNQFRFGEDEDVDVRVRPDGTIHLSKILDGEWVEYTIPKVTDGYYDVHLKVATPDTYDTTSSITVRLNDQKLGTIDIDYTGGYNVYKIISLNGVAVPGGFNQVLRLEFGGGDFYLDNVEFEKVGAQQKPFDLHYIPGWIEAEDYDEGGEGLAYHDATEGNSASAYRSDDVDIKERATGTIHLTSIEDSEWVEYTISESLEGFYDVKVLIATPDSYDTTSVVKVIFDEELLDSIKIEYTGAWDKYDTFKIEGVDISGGYNHVFRFEFAGGSFYFDKFGIEESTIVPETMPFSVQNIPGIVEVENYDIGGQNLSYYDATIGNSGGVYRSDDVDIGGPTADDKGGYDLGWIADGEWLVYTIANIDSGNYNIHCRIASNDDTKTKNIMLSLDGNVIDTINVPYTAGWSAWETVTLSDIIIDDAENVKLRLDFEGGAFSMNYIEFEKISGSSSVANIRLGELRIYPNPSTGKIFIDYLGSIPIEKDAYLKVVDMLGREALKIQMESSHVELSKSELSQGLFIIQIIVNGQVLEQSKLIVK